MEARLLRGLALAAALTCLIGFADTIRRAPSIIENDHRLAPTFAVAHGYKLYYGPTEGPILSTIYGPVTALAYAPALVASTPMGAVRLGTVITLVLFLAPLLLFAGKSLGEGSDWQTYACALGLAAALTYLSEALSASATLIHADAPALAAGALACWFSVWRIDQDRTRWAEAALAGVATALAVMSKQNMIALGPALACWWFAVSRKGALAYVAATGAALGAIWVSVLPFSSDLAAAWFNWFQIPTHQPYDKARFFPILATLVRSLLLFGLMLATSLGNPEAGRRSSLREVIRKPVFLLLWVSCWLIPTSVLGRLKAGGNENALGPAAYLLVLACMTVFSGYFRSRRESPSWRASTVALGLVLGAFVMMRLPEHLLSLRRRNGPTGMEIVYQYDRQNPGRVYFPQFPLAVLMAENRLYDFSWALSDRRAAGYPVSDASFLEHTPAAAHVMALTPWVGFWEKDIYSRCRAGGDVPADAALPDFSLCDFR